VSRGRGARHTARTLTGAALAAGAARGVYALLLARPPGDPAAWTRTNHRGEPVTLLEGPAAAAGAALAAALTPGLPGRARAGLVTAAAGAGAFGGYDDLAGSGGRRGFRGHLGALAHGEVTTGAVKLGGIGATGLAASVLLGGGALDVTVNAGLIAGSANLLNLFDLRPGRAIKVAALAGGLLAAAGRPRRTGDAAAPAGPVQAGPVLAGPVLAGPVLAGPVLAGPVLAGPVLASRVPGATLAAIPLGAALALAGEDLGERAMLGDAGANALGAMLGGATAASLPRTGRVAVLAGIVALTAASEKVSFTKVIRRTPPLHWLDMLGRRPGPAPAAGSATDRPGSHQPVAPGTTASPP
jgi:UDP-GlcNAc:undecaprenyl-phosphate/decaprenyl-phosphate GlcNAc-1-phosphate transferase